MDYICANHPKFRMVYDTKFQGNENRRRAFIERSHKVPPAELIQWIKAEVQDARKHVSRLYPPGLEQTKSNNDERLQRFNADVLVVEKNDASAETYPVRSFTQEITHCHVAMFNPSTMHCYPARCNQSCHVVSSEV